MSRMMRAGWPILVIVALLATFDHAAHASQSHEPAPRHLIPIAACTSSAGQHPDPRPDSTGPKNLYISPWVAPFTWPGSSVPFALFGGVSIEKRIPIRATELMGLSAGIGYMGNNDVDPLRGLTLVLQGVIMRRLSRTGTTAMYFGLTYIKPWGNVLPISSGTEVDSGNPLNSIDVTLGIDLAVQQDMTFDACVRVPLAHPLVPDGGYVMFGLALHVAIGE